MSADKQTNTLDSLVRQLLEEIGEDPGREGLLRTPQRYIRAIKELTSGYSQNITDLVNGAIFAESCREMVVVKRIEFYSLCEHHLLPFFGFAHVGYVPNGRIIGLSKIPRLVQMFARRLQVQERLTEQVTSALDELLAPMGAACVIEASHMCMMMRGIQVQQSSMITNSMRGVFLKNHATRDEFLRLIK